MIRRFGPEVAGLPTLAVTVAERLGSPVPRSAFADGGALIDYRGRPGTIPTVSFSALLAGKADPELLRDRVVVIGATAPTLHDQHATPQGSDLMSGPEVQANAIWTALHGLPLSSAPPWLDVLLILLAAASRAADRPAGARHGRGTGRPRARRGVRRRPPSSPSSTAPCWPRRARWQRWRCPPSRPWRSATCSRASSASGSRRSTTCSRSRSASARASCGPPSWRSSSGSAQAVESRDEETGEHIERIAQMCPSARPGRRPGRRRGRAAAARERDARRRQDRDPRRHPAQARPADSGRARGHAAPHRRRRRPARRLALPRRPARRGDRTHAPRALERGGLPGRPRGRGHPARRSHHPRSATSTTPSSRPVRTSPRGPSRTPWTRSAR